MRSDRDKLKTQWSLYFHLDQTTVARVIDALVFANSVGFGSVNVLRMRTKTFSVVCQRIENSNMVFYFVNALPPQHTHTRTPITSSTPYIFLLILEMSHFAKNPWTVLIDPGRISDFPVHRRRSYPGLQQNRCLS